MAAAADPMTSRGRPALDPQSTALIDIGEVVPGRVGEEGLAVDCDAAGDVASHASSMRSPDALLGGARVLAVRSADIPGNGAVAAILHFAVQGRTKS